MFKRRGSGVDVVFVLLVVCLFAISSLFIILLGGQVYQRVAERSQSNFERRTGLSYVINKVRSGDQAGAVNVERQIGENVLRIAQDSDGKTYYTYIYYYNGAIRELMTDSAEAFDPQLGQDVVKALGFSVDLTSNRLNISVIGEAGLPSSCTLLLRSGVSEAAKEGQS